MPEKNPAYARLDSRDSTLCLDLRHGSVCIVYWGDRLADDSDLATLAALKARETPPNALAEEPRVSLTPLIAEGCQSTPGLRIGGGSGWSAAPRLVRVDTATPGRIALFSYDPRTRITLCHDLAMDSRTGVVSASTRLLNESDSVVLLEHLSAPVIPVPGHCDRIIGFHGRWSGEFAMHEIARFAGAYVRDNRRGRTSHDNFPGVILAAAGCTELAGEAYGFHLAASGNHTLRVEQLADGRACVAMGALLLPGEIRLAPGAQYQSPVLYAVHCNAGLSAMSRKFHRHVRDNILPPTVKAKPRLVHYNTWEAVYFNHNTETLSDLARRAAAVGAERFVLDDGWFGGRRNDRAGLGDWTVSAEVYPVGLQPLIAEVNALGMEFGLWVEPEMVNADSALFRAHPDWVLAAAGVDQLPFRNQLVLDLSRPEVSGYLFGCIDALLSAHPIRYLKWDMNRDVTHPGGADGSPVMHRQVIALHGLIDRIRAAYPAVEIESCASGGGRANYEILKRTDRIWTSDSNDAIDRLSIQRGFSMFFPPEVMGAHVGPRDCHITGRRVSMAMRAGVAMFGHMGLELDLREMDGAETATLADAVALYKRLRPLLHSGDLYRLPMPAPVDAFGVVAADRREALFSYAVTGGHAATLPPTLRLAGLDAGADYRLDAIWPRTETLSMTARGDMLMSAGLQMPLRRTQSIIVLHLCRA